MTKADYFSSWVRRSTAPTYWSDITISKEMVSADILFLEGSKRGKLVDVSRRNGSFLATMHEFEWDVQGIEGNIKAVLLSQQRDHLPITSGSLEYMQRSDASVDIITMRHVMEHFHDPPILMRNTTNHCSLEVGLMVWQATSKVWDTNPADNGMGSCASALPSLVFFPDTLHLH